MASNGKKARSTKSKLGGGNGGAPAATLKQPRQLQQQEGAATAISGTTALPKRAITSLQSQYRKMGDAWGAMGKTLTELGVPLPVASGL